ncbi:FdhF/YdeP family oxidoreductase [Salsipaludibacter albus]|uniref:FdhF/YdeP family oxidoreductase n=1 Tax=Salsipaludibacter albus TaxID=2849650 RepID=UPI001EE3E638|nr:FdhF/YdeP family oxidoreductase [Salsipaludibacter albus]MBY5163388.1 FdhF/YdeP family oxidoreductase [Salsipaludibacter albus]
MSAPTSPRASTPESTDDLARRRRALGPTTLTGDFERTPIKDTAAGVTAVAVTARQLLRTGVTRGLPLLRDVNQRGGFDCPSCAWPDPRGERSFAEFCENGAKAVADAGDRRVVTADHLARHSIDELAGWRDKDLNAWGRLAEPVVRRPGDDRYRPIGWEDAFTLVAEHLQGLDSPDQASFYTSGRTSNEAAFLYQLFVRAYGTNNLPDCSNMCHESSGSALSPTIGIGKGTVLLEDFDEADVIVIMGQNPGTNHPRMLTALQHAAEGGATIVGVNPVAETGLNAVRNPQDFKDPRRVKEAITGTQLSSMHLPVRIGGDLALVTGVLKELLARDRDGRDGIDHEFVEANVTGHDELVAHLDTVDWATVEREAGIGRDRIAAFADLLAGTDRIIVCWAMGLTQHTHAVDTIRQLANLVLWRGAIGKPGAGLCPVRGHSNVQGDRTVGIWDKPPPAFLDRLAEAVGFAPPYDHGVDVVDTIRGLRDGSIRVLMSMGGNLLSAGPDTIATAEGLERAELTVHVATKLNRSHLVCGETSLILPCLARTDVDEQAAGPQFVTVENSMGIVTTSRGTNTPVSDALRSEPAIVAGLASATLGAEHPVDWGWLVDDYDRIRDLVEASVAGFDDYNTRVRADEGLELANPARHGDFSSLPEGRARLSVAEVPVTDLPDDVLVMMTIRSHDQFNTTIYDHDDRYRGVRGERRVVLLNPDDLAAHGLVEGDVVDLVSQDGERLAETFLALPHDLPRGNCATYFPEANVLVDLDAVARESNTPVSKHVPIRLRAVAAADVSGRS